DWAGRPTQMRFSTLHRRSITTFLRFVLFICLLLAPSFAIVQSAFSKNIMIFMAHPDDEAVATAGIINTAATNGDNVKVVIFTNGDIFDVFGSPPGTALGYKREGE